MFLDINIRRNIELIEAAMDLHQEGKIRPNTYVLDLDRIEENAIKLKLEADKSNIKLYMMTKQIGRNPEVAKLISDVGINKAVAVDPWEALVLARNGIEIGNVGHLVQIPSNMIKEIVELDPEVITVFTVEKAREISQEAEKQGKVQDIILKIIDHGDLVYEGQRGGFRKGELIESAKRIMEYRGVRIIGATSFPCLLYDSQEKRVVETHNVKTLLDSAKILEEDLGLEVEQINFPSANSVSTISTIKELGGTHGEPGHSFTGTIPINAHIDQPEIPALVYISEISHIYGNEAYAYGGGYYRRGNMERAIVGSNLEKGLDNILKVVDISPTNIDYYGGLELGNRKVKIGDTVVYAFRSQIFVTRSEIALVRGISNGRPKLTGIYDSLGNRLK